MILHLLCVYIFFSFILFCTFFFSCICSHLYIYISYFFSNIVTFPHLCWVSLTILESPLLYIHVFLFCSSVSLLYLCMCTKGRVAAYYRSRLHAIGQHPYGLFRLLFHPPQRERGRRSSAMAATSNDSRTESRLSWKRSPLSLASPRSSRRGVGPGKALTHQHEGNPFSVRHPSRPTDGLTNSDVTACIFARHGVVFWMLLNKLLGRSFSLSLRLKHLSASY